MTRYEGSWHATVPGCPSSAAPRRGLARQQEACSANGRATADAGGRPRAHASLSRPANLGVTTWPRGREVGARLGRGVEVGRRVSRALVEKGGVCYGGAGFVP